jgi:predicted LPLAT superfamily acyltransferase/glycosyltransferase involved in cell wall biosynthesis
MQSAVLEPSIPRSCDVARACVVIPVYNHAHTVGDVVRGALEHASSVIVCDDGSSDGSGDVALGAGASVLRHPRNMGKGAALRSLLAAAKERGFRYAISMDADGQHLAADLQIFCEATHEHAGALVVGTRSLVAAGAPPSSEFGRKFSNFWVWFESGVRVPDSQSGFRAYPLPEAVDFEAWGTRYEFECDMLLRAGWAGIPVRAVPIRVVYPANRITHFRLFLDNVRIVTLNVVTCLRLPLPIRLGPRLKWIPQRPGVSLFALRRWAWLGGERSGWRTIAAVAGVASVFGGTEPWARMLLLSGCVGGWGVFPAWVAAVGFKALLRFSLHPRLACALVLGAFALFGALEAMRLPAKSRSRRWTGKSRGGVFGHWFFFQLTRVFGISPAYWVVYPVSLYFLFAARPARKASMQYLERALGPAPLLRRFGRTYLHFLSFARTMVDRALFSTRGKDVFRYETDGLQHIEAVAATGQGAILLTAHLGNWPIAAGLLGEAGKKLAIVAYRGEHENLTRYLKKAQGPRPRIIDVGSDSLASLEMVRALREGHLLALQGDRRTDQHVVQVPFLGREAPFPVGPFVLAAITAVPLIWTFSLQVAPASYRFFAKPPMHFAFARGQSREAQLRAWVAPYVLELETVIRRFPYQWFNFYDFWDSAPPARLKPAPP